MGQPRCNTQKIRQYQKGGVKMPSLMRYINIISRCGAVWRGDKLKGTDIGPLHTGYIMTVCRHPGISQDKLAKRLCISKSNVTRTLATLEVAGYVERRQSENDKRVTEVYPTDRAREALPQVQEAVRSWNSYITEGFSEDEREMFASMLARMAERAADYAKLSIDAEDEGQ